MKTDGRSPRWLLLIALACVILGAKFIQIDRYGSDLPFWDQWDAEGDFLFRPYLEGRLAGHDLVAAHNEHRILFARLLALGLFAANDRQWDSRVELLANAAVHTLAALLLAGLALRMLPGGPAAAYAAMVACFFSTAVDWENTLGAFQSPFYFLIVFSGLHLGATLIARPRSWMWWLAPLAGAAALFTMGSGALSAAAILGAIGLRALRDRRLTRDDLWILTINGLLLIAGALLRVTVAGHHSLRAPDFPGGLEAWLCQLAWPVMTPWAAPLGLVPPLALAWAYLRRRIGGASIFGLLGACGWFWLQAAVLAYARGANLGCYASRYTDLLITGVLLNLLALIALAACARTTRRWFWVGLTVLFTGVALAGLSQEDSMARQAVLPVLPRLNAVRIAAVRSYVANRDPAFFRADNLGNLPYPSAPRLAQVLDSPALRAALPASVRAPMKFADEPGSTAGFGRVSAPAVPGRIPFGLQAWATISSGKNPPSPAHFLSEPFEIDHRRVSIFVAGTSPAEAIRLSLIDDQGHRHEPLDSALSPAMRWRQVNFISPEGRGRLEVSATRGWFAFTQPVTDTPLSHFAMQAAGVGPWLFAMGVGFYLVALIAGRIPAQAVHLLAEGWRTGARLTAAIPTVRLRIPPLNLGRFAKHPPLWFTLSVCAAVLAARKPDAWHNPQFWAEDGLFYQQAYTMGFHALFIPLLGGTYFAQKLIAELAVQFDPQWAPAIFMGCALAVTLYVAARAQSARCPLAFPFACALAVVLVPDTFEVLLTGVNIQWVLASGMLLLLISADPRCWWQYADDVALAVMSGLTGPFSLLWAPLFAWRAWQRRTRASLVMAVILVACGGAQACAMWHHPFVQITPGSSITDYGSVLPAIGMRVAGSLLAGSFLPANPPLIIETLGVVTLAGVALLAVTRRVPERIWLGLAFALLLAVSLCRWRGALPEMLHPGFGARYFYPLQLIVIWLAFAWASEGKRAARLATVFAVWVLLANLPRLREPPMVDFHWKDFARHLRSGEAVVVPINPPGWTIELPARKRR